MANLFDEYCKRHHLKCALPINDGLFFFNSLNKPALICLTGNSPRTYSYCSACKTPNIAVEFFTPDRDEGYEHIYHAHVDPDLDILAYTKKHISKTAEPVYLKEEKEIECWLWNFFLLNSRLRLSSSFKLWSSIQPTINPYEQMAWCAMKAPMVFNSYYNLYQTFTAGRKYIWLL